MVARTGFVSMSCWHNKRYIAACIREDLYLLSQRVPVRRSLWLMYRWYRRSAAIMTRGIDSAIAPVTSKWTCLVIRT